MVNKKQNAYKSEDIINSNQNQDTAQSAGFFVVTEEGEDVVLSSSLNETAKKKKKREKQKKVYRKTTFKHKLKVVGCLAALGVFTGSGLGVWYFNTALKSNVDYASLVAADFFGDVNDVFADLAISDTTTWVSQAQSNGLTPADVSVADNILLCEYNAQQASSWSIIGTGKVLSMGIAQTVYSGKTFDGTTYAFESISAGMLTVASCDVMTKDGATVDTYAGQNPTATGATWVNAKTVSVNEFEEMNGVMPDAVFPYIISDKTIDTASEITFDDASGLYSFTVTLKPVESVLLYYKQVQRSGGLEANPEFHSIEITFNINKNWQFVTSEIKESYKAVKFGMPVTCDGTISTTYEFDCEVTLPV